MCRACTKSPPLNFIQQATDTAILAITITTVFSITRISRSRAIQTEWSNRAIILTCIAIWIFPAITSMCFHIPLFLTTSVMSLSAGFLALGMHWYGPVSGNWYVFRQTLWSNVDRHKRCWLVEKPSFLRYVLTHGWRYLFMLIEASPFDTEMLAC